MIIRRLLQSAKRQWHRVKYAAKARYGLFDPVTIVPYRSWGTTRRIRVQGRVIEEAGLNRATAASGVLDNIGNTLRRLESDEVPDARLEVAFRGRSESVTADGEGFFRADVEPEVPLDGGWHRVGVQVVESIAGGAGVRATAEVRVPDPDADFIVISDVDDTVIVTRVNEPLEMVRRVVAGNVRTRKTFPGVPSFYRALARGRSASGNPIFYVSRTGWNFYDVIAGVLDLHDIPPGPMLMRDLALIESRTASLAPDEQKLTKIAEVMEAFPEQRFVLLGDSGQADPEIYAECATRYRGRIAAVYIRRAGGRDVAADTAETIRSHGAALCVAKTTLEMARHAAAHGLIAADDVDDVAQAMEREGGA